MKVTEYIKISILTGIVSIFVFPCFSVAGDPPWSDRNKSSELTIIHQGSDYLEIGFSLGEYSVIRDWINDEPYDLIRLNGPYMPGREGAPDLPSLSKFIALPQGASVNCSFTVVNSYSEPGLKIPPAPKVIKLDEPAQELKKDPVVFNTNEFYPAQPVTVSEVRKIRGVDVAVLAVTPFQYNPVTEELQVLREINIRIEFTGGNGHFGTDRLRSRWFDPILKEEILNFGSLPVMDYNRSFIPATKETGAEYLVICPDLPVFQQWADSIRQFRTTQGILTKVATIAEIGGNTAQLIEEYINNAYNTWDIPPVGVLCLGDHGTSGGTVAAPIWNSYCVSDNVYADVDGDELPDIVVSRICAENATQLEAMVKKFIHYEKNPPVSQDFYDHPITSCQFVTGGWGQILTESVAGYYEVIPGKSTNRLNVATLPLPLEWSTAPNTQALVDYFGPNGLGYIPATPGEVNCTWDAATQDVIDGINNGAFMLLHKGVSSELGWGQPSFTTGDVNGLTNTDPVFVWSVDGLTGKFNSASECFAEKIHRYSYNGNPSGALGVVAASEVTYSFITDVYAWGAFDYLFPNYLPDFNSTPESIGVLPAFANIAAKYYLEYSAWPYNPANKDAIYNLFHCFGDAFSTVYTEMPLMLDVSHQPWLLQGATTFDVSANEGSLIALSVDGELIGVAEGTGSPVAIQILPQTAPSQMLVTVTKQNHYRYEGLIDVVNSTLQAWFTASDVLVCEGESVQFFDESVGSVTYREWTFEGGTPSVSSEQNPVIVYETAGVFNVTLIVSDGNGWDTLTMENYITVEDCTGLSGNPPMAEPAVYPNPAEDQIKFTFDRNPGNIMLMIRDLEGRALPIKTIKTDGKEMQVDLSALSPGCYIYSISASGQMFSGKILVR